MIFDYQTWITQYYIKNTNAIECLSYNKTFKQRPTTETFSISKYHCFECILDQFEIIEASKCIGRIVGIIGRYYFKLKNNNEMSIKLSQTLVYTSSLLILENNIWKNWRFEVTNKIYYCWTSFAIILLHYIFTTKWGSSSQTK